MKKFDFLRTELEKLQTSHLRRSLVCIDSAQGPIVEIAGRTMLSFCSNNYLSLAGHPRITKAVVEAVNKYGYGSAASRLITGTMGPHIKAEQALAKMFSKEAALIFPSGWTANEAVIKTIPQKTDIILLDKLSHASIIDAAKAGQAQFRTYRRDNLKKLERFLADKNYKRKFIVTESIFSMDGDKADLQQLVELKQKYNAFLIVDEAHSFGCLGPTGAGLAEQMGLLDDVDIIVATLSKAVGATGGVVAGSATVIDYLVNKARAFIYTTAGSPVNCAAVSEAIEIIKQQPQRRKRLQQNAQYLRQKLKAIDLDTGTSQSHIIPVIIGDSHEALKLAARLFEQGFFIPAIRPPTVPAGTARLRISLQADHTKKHLNRLYEALTDAMKKKTKS